MHLELLSLAKTPRQIHHRQLPEDLRVYGADFYVGGNHHQLLGDGAAFY